MIVHYLMEKKISLSLQEALWRFRASRPGGIYKVALKGHEGNLLSVNTNLLLGWC
jgi:hypothetical protein